MATSSHRKIARYGWKPDLPDARDHVFKVARGMPLPRSVDLRPKMPAVYDQGELGSCTANAIAAAIEHERIVQGLADFVPSRLFIYYLERAVEGDVAQDGGAQIRDGIKCVAKQGACPEADWPYVVSKFAAKPPARAYKAALKDLVASYEAVPQTERAIKTALAADRPVVIGFTCYESFESEEVARTGVLNLPARGEKIVGGHAVVIVGYDDGDGRWLVRNSWGPAWGQAGHFTVPYAYFTSTRYASDLWVVDAVAA